MRRAFVAAFLALCMLVDAGICAGTPLPVMNETPPQAVSSSRGAYYPMKMDGGDLCLQMAETIRRMPAAGGTIDANGLAATSPTICRMNPFAENNASATPKPVLLLLGPGRIATETPWVISSDHVHIRGAGVGSTAIQYTGDTAIVDPSGKSPGGVVEFYRPPGGTKNLADVSLSDLRILGNDAHPSAAPYGLLISQVIHSAFHRLQIWGVGKAGVVEIGLDVMVPLYDVHVSMNEIYNGDPHNAPQDGIVLMGSSDAAQVTESTITNPIIEGITGCGMVFGYTHGMYVQAGLIEQNGTQDVCINTTTPRYSTQDLIIDGTDFEVTPLAMTDRGLANQFRNLTLQNGGLMRFQGVRALVIGGQMRQIEISDEARNTTFQSVNFLKTPADQGLQTAYLDSFYMNQDSQNSILPCSSREQTRVFVGNQGRTTNPKSHAMCVLDFNGISEVAVDPTPLEPGSSWKMLLSGEWRDNIGDHPSDAAQIEISSSHPVVHTPGGVSIRFGLNNKEILTGRTDDETHTAEFIGELVIIPLHGQPVSAVAFQSEDASLLGHGSTVGGREICLRDGAGCDLLTTSITTTAAASDTVHMQGLTPSGHCWLPNPLDQMTAQAGSAFVSAKGNGELVLTHPPIAGLRYDIGCTAY